MLRNSLVVVSVLAVVACGPTGPSAEELNTKLPAGGGSGTTGGSAGSNAVTGGAAGSGVSGGSGGSGPGLRPDSRRNREFLEQFSLDTLRMVGTLRLSDRTYGLIKTKDGLVHRVLPGNYLGQADGRVTDISPSKISVVEIIPDGLGGYMERPASLALNN